MRMKDENSKVVAFTIVPHQEDEDSQSENTPNETTEQAVESSEAVGSSDTTEE